MPGGQFRQEHGGSPRCRTPPFADALDRETLEDVGDLVLVGWETATWLVRDGPKFGLLRGKEGHHGMNP